MLLIDHLTKPGFDTNNGINLAALLTLKEKRIINAQCLQTHSIFNYSMPSLLLVLLYKRSSSYRSRVQHKGMASYFARICYKMASTDICTIFYSTLIDPPAKIVAKKISWMNDKDLTGSSKTCQVLQHSLQLYLPHIRSHCSAGQCSCNNSASNFYIENFLRSSFVKHDQYFFTISIFKRYS